MGDGHLSVPWDAGDQVAQSTGPARADRTTWPPGRSSSALIVLGHEAALTCQLQTTVIDLHQRSSTPPRTT